MKKRKIKKLPFVILIIILLLICLITYFILGKKQTVKKKEKDMTKEIKAHYSEYVKTGSDIDVFNEKEKVIGKVSNVILKLKDQKIDNNTEYFYAENIDAYVSYKDVEKSEKKEEYVSNYIPFNEEIKTNGKINIDENAYYKLDKDITFRPIKKDEGKYYFIYDGNYAYINEDDIKDKKDIDEYKYTSEVPVINYHYVISEDERKDCQQSICMLETQYDEQMKYLKDNGYYTATMEDLDLWIDKKINLPEKTVVITIDDGWFVARNIQILQKYDLHGTLFLIGHLASPDDYKSPNLEIHSHTWDMHNLGECPIKRGGAILCKDRDYVLNDLKKSRESLNNSEYFAYPFYEYNDHAIKLLKEAGFKMAFAGGGKKVTQGCDKYTVPRFGITNTGTLNEFIRIIS